MRRVTSFFLLASLALSCTNDWATKADTQKISGHWRLVDIVAFDPETSEDTTWTTEGGFIDFEYKRKGGPASCTYMLAHGDLIKTQYSIVEGRGSILFMSRKDDYKPSIGKKIAFPINNQNPVRYGSKGELIIEGKVVIRDTGSITTSGKLMRIQATFTK